MTWNHPALSQRALDEGDREITDLRQRLAAALDQLGKVSAQLGGENAKLRERVYWAESSLDTWDDEKDASYWQRYSERMASPFALGHQQTADVSK